MKVKLGDKATAKKKFSKEDVEKFAKLTGDYNLIHFDHKYASNTIFKKPIVHGPLVVTLITTLFAQELPGRGSVYLSHNLYFLKPVYYDETITAELEVIDINKEGHIFIKTDCYNERKDIVISGIARLKKY